jgi:hypothetical protein
LQDVFGMPATSYHVDEEPGYVPPDWEPQPAPNSYIFDIPYRELVSNLGRTEVDRLDVYASYICAVAKSPGWLHTGFEVLVRAGTTAPFVKTGNIGTFCLAVKLANALSITATSATLELDGLDELDIPDENIGEAALLGDEVVRIDAINHVTGVVQLGRGCLDTVPVEHPAGTILWFYGGRDDVAYNTTEFTSGTLVNTKLITRTSNGSVLPESDAPTNMMMLYGRQGRPYPPGQFRIKGLAYPASISGSVSVSWAHRNRIVQSDLLVDTLAGSIGREPGTTYRIRIQNAGGEVLVDESDLTGTSWTWQTNPNSYDLALLHFNGNLIDSAGTTWAMGSGTAFDSAGKFGGCITLGAGTANGLTTNKAYALSTSNFTVELWVKPEQALSNFFSIFRTGTSTGAVNLRLGANGVLNVMTNNVGSSSSANGVWSANGNWHQSCGACQNQGYRPRSLLVERHLQCVLGW